MRPIDTEAAVLYLIRERPLKASDPRLQKARWVIYRWARDGLLTNHGGPRRGQARWDIAELDTVFRRYLKEHDGRAPWNA